MLRLRKQHILLKKPNYASLPAVGLQFEHLWSFAMIALDGLLWGLKKIGAPKDRASSGSSGVCMNILKFIHGCLHCRPRLIHSVSYIEDVYANMCILLTVVLIYAVYNVYISRKILVCMEVGLWIAGFQARNEDILQHFRFTVVALQPLSAQQYLCKQLNDKARNI